MIKKNRNRIILFFCWLTYTSVYTGRLNLSIASPLLQANNIMDKVSIGTLSSVFFFVYAFGRIFNGYLGDKYNPKLLLIVGLTMAALSNMIIGFLPSNTFIFLLWGINGFFQSMLWSPALKLVTATYKDNPKHSKAVIILSTSIGFGSILAICLATYASTICIGAIFIIPSILMLIISVLLSFILPNPYDKRNKPIMKFQKKNIKKLNTIIKKMLLPVAVHGMIKDNLSLWIPLFFIEMYNMDLKSASFYIFMMPVATLCGRFMFPFIFKICKNNELLVCASSFLICLFSLVPFAIIKPSPLIAAILLSAVSIFLSIINTSFLSVFPTRFQNNNQVSLVSGILDFITYMGSALGSIIIGILIHIYGYNSMILTWILLSSISMIIIYKNRNMQSS